MIMYIKRPNSSPNFKGFNIYNSTAYVQEHTLINRGITTLGGSTIPQCIMSNNKHEAKERAIMGVSYVVASLVAPMLLIPLYNRHFLKNKGIIKSFKGVSKDIILMSKKYLTKNANLKEGLDKTAELLDKNKNGEHKKAFDEIYKRYNNPEKLKQDLLNVHEKVLMTDFISTGSMWALGPWLATEYTEHKTKRSDYSGGFDMKNDNQISKEDLKKSKQKKIYWNVVFSTIPAIIFAKTVTKGLKYSPSRKGKNIFTKLQNKIYENISKNPKRFDYSSGTNMSKFIYASIWVLSSFPAKIISSRDKNERKDRALRDIGLFTMFFSGDFLINNVLGRLSDKFLGTKIIDNKNNTKDFWKKFTLPIKDFKSLKLSKNMPKETLIKTKNVGACLYWTSLLANTIILGFLMPALLNKMLNKNIKSEKI